MQNKVCFELCGSRFLVSFVATLHFCLLLALVPSPQSPVPSPQSPVPSP
ncbi:TPA: hypothetical protein I7183_07060 [Vibrio vulnificus]|nr:hypothetical protein [Vibrio vulnificus]